MRFSTICSSFFLSVFLSACGGQNDAGAATIDATVEVDSATVVVDTVAVDTVAVVDVKMQTDSINISKISTAQEAIDYMRNSPDADKYEAGILMKLAEQSLDYTKRLLHNKHDYFIVVDKPSMYVVLFDKYGREKQSYKMACARNYGTKHKKSDCRTPEGFFTAEGIYNSTDWLYTDDFGYTSPTRGVYGPRFIRLNTPVTRTVGIHGTNSPGSLGRRASHGCVRLHNNSILDLVKYAKKGMPVIVNPSNRDQEVNRREGTKVVQINIGKPTVTDPIPAQDSKKRGEEVDSVSEPMASGADVEVVPDGEKSNPAGEPEKETPSAAPETPATPEAPSTPSVEV